MMSEKEINILVHAVSYYLELVKMNENCEFGFDTSWTQESINELEALVEKLKMQLSSDED